jgi:hypothetical protein
MIETAELISEGFQASRPGSRSGPGEIGTRDSFFRLPAVTLRLPPANGWKLFEVMMMLAETCLIMATTKRREL